MTLPEVMIALLIVAAMCLTVFGGLNMVSKWALHSAISSEAQRLLQAEAERLLSVPYAHFVAGADETSTSSVGTTFLAGMQPRLSYPPTRPGARVSFTRRVIAVASTATSRTLRIEVAWTWHGGSHVVATPLYRAQ
jgi:type II secretory pathway pseudopilin PulG